MEQNLKRRSSEKYFDQPRNKKVQRIQTNLQLKVIQKENSSEPIEESHINGNENNTIKILFKKIFSGTEGLREALGQCSAFATFLPGNSKLANLLKSECQAFEIDYKELIVPSPGQWISEISFLKSVLDLKVAIFFAGEKDEEFESKAPSVEQIQLLENVVPILEKMDSRFEANNEDPIPELCQDLEKMTEDDISVSASCKSMTKFLLKEIELLFPQKRHAQ